jgi:hypothetical protein
MVIVRLYYDRNLHLKGRVVKNSSYILRRWNTLRLPGHGANPADLRDDGRSGSPHQRSRQGNWCHAGDRSPCQQSATR